MLMILKLFKRSCPIVLLTYVFSCLNPLNERSEEHDVAGITHRSFTTFVNSGMQRINHYPTKAVECHEDEVFDEL